MNTVNHEKVAVVIPCYNVAKHIEGVVGAIPEMVNKIYCIDDACPQNSREIIAKIVDPRVVLLKHDVNQGVGAAVITGYKAALEDNMDIIVKIDGDGQMDPSLISVFVTPILEGECDYTKGNRFYRVDDVRAMPAVRLFGNAVLSFITKISSGYWTIFDPNNGYTAIHAKVLKELPLEKIAKRFFFESDLLFRLNTIRAAIQDIPMRAVYDNEESNLRISGILFPFLCGHLRNFAKRIFYNYVLRDFSVATIQLFLGVPFVLFGLIFGWIKWSESVAHGVTASPGTVMLCALPVIVGMQFLLSFLNYDIRSVPERAVHKKLRN